MCAVKTVALPSSREATRIGIWLRQVRPSTVGVFVVWPPLSGLKVATNIVLHSPMSTRDLLVLQEMGSNVSPTKQYFFSFSFQVYSAAMRPHASSQYVSTRKGISRLRHQPTSLQRLQGFQATYNEAGPGGDVGHPRSENVNIKPLAE